MNAVQREVASRLMKEKETATPISRGKTKLTANQWTLLVVGIITIVTIVLNQFGLII